MGQIIRINEDILYNIILQNLMPVMKDKVITPSEFVNLADKILKDCKENERN